MLIQDEVETSRAVELAWTMHTQAAVEVQGDRALLTQGGAVLEARLLRRPAPRSRWRTSRSRCPSSRPGRASIAGPPAGDDHRPGRGPVHATSEPVGGGPGTVTATATFPISGTAGTGPRKPAPYRTTTPTPIGPPLPASPAESLPPPEIVNLNRWATIDAPGLESDTQT